QGVGRQPDLGWRAGSVGPDVGVTDLLATGAFGPGLPESPPSRHAGSAGPASLTRVMAGVGTSRRLTRPDGRAARGPGRERRTSRCRNQGGHYGFPRLIVFPARPAAEQGRSATSGLRLCTVLSRHHASRRESTFFAILLLTLTLREALPCRRCHFFRGRLPGGFAM